MPRGEDAGQFIQVLWRPKPAVTVRVAGENTREVTPEVARLLPLCRKPVMRLELQRALSLKDDDHFQVAYLLPAMAGGYLEMTIPEKPRSRMQRYQLTEKGREWLAGQAK